MTTQSTQKEMKMNLDELNQNAREAGWIDAMDQAKTMITDEYPAHTADAIYETAAKRMVNLAIDENDTINRLVVMGRIERLEELLEVTKNNLDLNNIDRENDERFYCEKIEHIKNELRRWELLEVMKMDDFDGEILEEYSLDDLEKMNREFQIESEKEVLHEVTPSIKSKDRGRERL